MTTDYAGILIVAATIANALGVAVRKPLPMRLLFIISNFLFIMYSLAVRSPILVVVNMYLLIMNMVQTRLIPAVEEYKQKDQAIKACDNCKYCGYDIDKNRFCYAHDVRIIAPLNKCNSKEQYKPDRPEGELYDEYLAGGYDDIVDFNTYCKTVHKQ